MNKPTGSDIEALEAGTAVRVDGKRFLVTGQYGSFTTLSGPRGGWANLVPSTDGKRVQLTRHTSNARVWVNTLEIV